MLNQVTIIGRLTRDPHFIDQDTNPRALATVAVDRARSDGTDFIGIIAWGKGAEILRDHYTKGDLISVEGELRSSTFDRDGTTEYRTDLVATRTRILSHPHNGTANADDTF